jgi:MFS family permease
MKRKIPKQVFVLGLISFFTDFASEMLYPVVPLFLTTVLGASMSVVGVIEGVAEVTASLLKGYFGALSDKLRKRAIFVRLGYTLSAIVKPLPGFFPFLGTVVTSRTLDRVGKGIRTAPRDALLAANADKTNRGAIFGFHRSMDTLGAVVGPLAALLILYLSGDNFRLVFYFAMVPSIGAIFYAFRAKEPEVKDVKVREYHFSEFWKEAPKAYKKLLVLITIFSIANSSDVFLILKLKSISSDSTAILGYVFFNIIYALFSYPAGVLSDKFSKRLIFGTGLIIFSAVYTGFSFADNLPVIFILFTLYGLYSAATDGISKAWISDFVDDRNRATAIGLYNSVTGLGILLGSSLAGFLWDSFSSEVPFAFSAAVSLIIGIIILVDKKEY